MIHSPGFILTCIKLYTIEIEILRRNNKTIILNLLCITCPTNMIYMVSQLRSIYMRARRRVQYGPRGDMCGIEEVGVQMGWGGVEGY